MQTHTKLKLNANSHKTKTKCRLHKTQIKCKLVVSFCRCWSLRTFANLHFARADIGSLDRNFETQKVYASGRRHSRDRTVQCEERYHAFVQTHPPRARISDWSNSNYKIRKFDFEFSKCPSTFLKWQHQNLKLNLFGPTNSSTIWKITIWSAHGTLHHAAANFMGCPGHSIMWRPWKITSWGAPGT